MLHTIICRRCTASSFPPAHHSRHNAWSSSDCRRSSSPSFRRERRSRHSAESSSDSQTSYFANFRHTSRLNCSRSCWPCCRSETSVRFRQSIRSSYKRRSRPIPRPERLRIPAIRPVLVVEGCLRRVPELRCPRRSAITPIRIVIARVTSPLREQWKCTKHTYNSYLCFIHFPVVPSNVFKASRAFATRSALAGCVEK